MVGQNNNSTTNSTIDDKADKSDYCGAFELLIRMNERGHVMAHALYVMCATTPHIRRALARKHLPFLALVTVTPLTGLFLRRKGAGPSLPPTTADTSVVR